jgi:hypothetical protein
MVCPIGADNLRYGGRYIVITVSTAAGVKNAARGADTASVLVSAQPHVSSYTNAESAIMRTAHGKF